MAALRSAVRPVGRRMIVSVGLAAAGAIAGVVALFCVAEVLGALLERAPDRRHIAVLIGAALLGAILRFSLRSVSIRVSHLASYDLEVILRRGLVDHLARLPIGEVNRIGSGTLKKIVVDDVRDLHTAVGDIPPLLGFAVAGPLAAMGILFATDWVLALAALSLAPIAYLTLRLALRDRGLLRKAYDDANEAMNGAVVELVQGMPVVRVFDSGALASARFRRAVDSFTDAMSERNYTGRTATTLTQLFAGPLPTLLIVIVAGTALLAGSALSRGDFLVFMVLGTVPVDTVRPLLLISEYIQESKAGAARIGDILAIPELAEPAHPVRPHDASIRLESVRFRYDGDREPALDGVDLYIPPGTVCALVGASGAGKSTVARLVSRFWDVDDGSVQIGGVDVRQIGTAELLRIVAVVFQEPFLVHDTVRENIRMARPDADDGEVEAAAEAACAHRFIVDELAEGYDTVVGERGARLSGGQRQRITIARALLSDARIVVLDEATAFADPENELAIQNALAHLCRERTVLVVAHRLATIVDADQIIVLDRGRVAEHGDHGSLLGAGGRYADLWRDHEAAAAWGLGGRA